MKNRKSKIENEKSQTPGPIRMIEQIECPLCDARLSPREYQRAYADDPRLHTQQMTLTLDCPHCGHHHEAQYHLNMGVWVLNHQTELTGSAA